MDETELERWVWLTGKVPETMSRNVDLSLRAWDAIISFKWVGGMSACYKRGMDSLTQTEMFELLSVTQGDSILQ